MATTGVSSCEWVSLRSALARFVTFRGSTQSQRHIKPLHWYVACRLVVEGGFDPDDIVPRPPFRVERKGGRSVLVHDPSRGGSGERTVYGGLKTKNVDVVVTKEGIGSVLARRLLQGRRQRSGDVRHCRSGRCQIGYVILHLHGMRIPS